MVSMTPLAAISPSSAPSDATAVVAHSRGNVLSSILDEDERDDILASFRGLADISSPNATHRIVSRSKEHRQIIAVSLPPDPSPGDLRDAAGAGVRAAGEALNVVVDMPHANAEEFEALAEGAGLGAYRFTAYKSGAGAATKVSVVTGVPAAPVKRVRRILEAQCAVRDLVNTPGGDLGPSEFVRRIRSLAEGPGNLAIDVEVLEEAELRAKGCGGLLGVGKGSQEPPRLVRMEWNPAGARAHIALVGKGITFDSGGMSLKSHEGLTDMKTDMAGAACAAAAVRACAGLRIPARVTAWLCVAENMLSASAIRVGDVLRTADGTTVEVTNTDAEGRLVLADGLALASRENPDEVIDVATLTGAQIRALGTRCAGLMGSSNLVSDIASAAESAGEILWPMPLPDYLEASLSSNVADMKNSAGPEAGMLVAGVFLRRFAGDAEWAHLDIAGPSFNTGEGWGCTPSGATGYGVRTLVRHIERAAKAMGSQGA